MRVLITGITGFVGSHMAEYALSKGAQVFGSNRWRSKTENIDHLRSKVTFLESDLRDLSSVPSLLEISNPDFVVHLAAQSFVGVSWHAPAETLTLVKSEWTQVPALKRLTEANIPDGKYQVRFLPLEEARKRAKDIPPGTVLMVVREHDPNRVVRISHMGFVISSDGGLVVRHASTGKDRAVLDEPFDAFVQRQTEYKKWKVIGVALARPLEARARVSRIKTAAR